MPATQLKTERLALDSLTVDDSAFVKRLVQNLRVRAYLGGVVSADQLDGIVDKYLELQRDGHVWIARFSENISIGLIFVTPHHNGVAPELSFQFDPRYWGHGLAYEACQRVLTHCENDQDLRSIVAETQERNAPARRLLHRLGFQEVTRLHRFGADQVVFSLDLNTNRN
ncbi:hypothetical protein GCM10007385_20470 [Tateyamaria omphalii]|uniref:GNAT family N-acetyltransferase n=1 Tax=Tateyamaria omphalii TaxID=299262 RepID=UPI00167BBDCC|nr:GNAT family N-acetyltransferase [Tateyamaria omphalii]GGX51737.1 hypothetical protein GCM10007385_20470 [Tateyamaria omphalii]